MVSVSQSLGDRPSYARFRVTSNHPTRKRYAAISAKPLARYCSKVKMPQHTSRKGMM